jgi:hypothetical protein
MNRTTILVVTLALASFGCDSSSGGAGGSGGGGSALAVTIQFAAKVGTEAFVCGDVYDNLGLPFGGSDPAAQQFFSVE